MSRTAGEAQVTVTAIDHEGHRYGAVVIPIEVFGREVPCVSVCHGDEDLEGGENQLNLTASRAALWLIGHGLPEFKAVAIINDAIHRHLAIKERRN